jgi:hypothetical protein
MDTYRFRLLSQAGIDACASAARAGLQAWAQQWCGTQPDWQIRCQAADHPAAPTGPSRWRCRSAGAAGKLWLAAAPAFETALSARLFPDPSPLPPDGGEPATLAGAVAADALEALLAMLSDALAGRATQADDTDEAQRLAEYRYGRGAALLTITLGGAALQVVLPAACQPPLPAPQHTAPRRPRVVLAQALRYTPVRLAAGIGEVEVTVGQLSMLAVGDVLTLPVGMDQPLRVTAPGGQTLCAAQLGLRGSHRAMRLLSIHNTKEPT